MCKCIYIFTFFHIFLKHPVTVCSFSFSRAMHSGTSARSPLKSPALCLSGKWPRSLYRWTTQSAFTTHSSIHAHIHSLMQRCPTCSSQAARRLLTRTYIFSTLCHLHTSTSVASLETLWPAAGAEDRNTDTQTIQQLTCLSSWSTF